MRRRLAIGAVCALMSIGCGESFESSDRDAGASGSGGSGGAGGAGGAAGSAAPVVLNEVDYDNPELDIAEFVELVNVSSSDVELTGLLLVLINGAPGSKTEYARVELSGSLPAGGYALIATASVAADPAALRFDFPGAENQIQNGTDSPDAVAIYSITRNEVVDALSYNGAVEGATISGAGSFDFVEGAATPLLDEGEGSLIRMPDGRDTNDASADWHKSTKSTPGAPNAL